MENTHWTAVDETAGDLAAEIIKGLLESQGIPVFLSQEGAGKVYSLNIGSLGRVQILVPSDSVEKAQEILEDYRAGKFEREDEEPGEDSEDRQGEDR